MQLAWSLSATRKFRSASPLGLSTSLTTWFQAAIAFTALVLVSNEVAATPNNSAPCAALPDLPLGMSGLPQTNEYQRISNGVDFVRIHRGLLSEHDHYTLSSGAVSANSATEITERLAAAQLEAQIEEIPEFGPRQSSLGQLVRVGNFDDKADASLAASQLREHGVSLIPRFTAEDGGPTSGPFVLSVMCIDLSNFDGSIVSTIGEDTVAGKETVSAMANRNGAIAALNSGFFAWNDEVGTDGDPAGIAVIDGQLVSEPIAGRPALIIDQRDQLSVYVAHDVRSEITLHIGNERFAVNGLNRRPGKVLNCGGLTPSPTNRPAHDFVCEDTNEVILYQPKFGLADPGPNDVWLAINDANEVVLSSEDDSVADTSSLRVVVAQGSSAIAIKSALERGPEIARITTALTSDEGTIPLQAGVYVTNGGPTLIRQGRETFTARAEEGWDTHFDGAPVHDGYVDPKDRAVATESKTGGREGFYHGWVVRRHPRTAVGIDTDQNILYFVVVYGRQPGVTAGANLTEMTRLFQALRVDEALNLDGGGSSSMIVSGELTGTPSDTSGERPVGDAVLILKPTSRSDKKQYSEETGRAAASN